MSSYHPRDRPYHDNRDYRSSIGRERDYRGPPPPDDYYPRRGGSGADHNYPRNAPPPSRQPYDRPQPRRGGRGGRGGGSSGPPRHLRQLIKFRSYEDEREWVEERRRKRRQRQSKFDIQPTLDGMSSFPPSMIISSGDIQQTRHARRLYIGNLPDLAVTEEEIHSRFLEAIRTALVAEDPSAAQYLEEDPILSVYINHERLFCFLEFKTVEITTACMMLDGLELRPGYPVKIKRPNDYNPMAMPKLHPSALPQLDVSRIGLISGTVLDGPNKIFIGGLHYNLTEQQVMELVQAFGKIKAFHLVKNESDPNSYSKGYCFVEYVDPAITPIAIQGLNGMEIGGGKSLTARLAGERTEGDPLMSNIDAVIQPPQPGVPPVDRNIVAGYDVEYLVDAALGQAPMPTLPQYVDNFGRPLTHIVSSFPAVVVTRDAALPTRILVLNNMVTDEDVATDENYQGLFDEVQEECAKFGQLKGIKIPRSTGDGVEASAIQKIWLEYATLADAQSAEQELNGRSFGSSVVEARFYPEADFFSGILR